MIRSFILAAALSAAVTATAWGQAGCEDIRKLRMEKVWKQANTAFDADAAEADEAYRQAFRTANAIHADALASAEAAYDGSLYWAFRSAEQLDHSAIADPVVDAAERRAHDRNAAHREWASSVSDTLSRWSASMEEAETRRSALVGENALRIEKQLSDCR
ncbi:MAG: hypothetical protein OXN81_22115 [Alphaproteobacteria bacterium]|nr:hypothetical protein [Alphaproteobacteria bacterium]